jgi:hypothetical protein
MAEHKHRAKKTSQGGSTQNPGPMKGNKMVFPPTAKQP